MSTDEQYMMRCIQLAKAGAGYVAPNPMVGAVLVYENKIIGEGYHQKYGQAHAEVNCINSVRNENKALIRESILYVSLEPCSHFGKTPPCTDLILENNIKKVIIGCRDIFKQMHGKGIQRLKDAGVEVFTGVLENACTALNKRFFTFHGYFRPYIILKWAQSANGKIGATDKRIFISNDYSTRLVHKWRSEEAGILIGTNTAIQDDPLLTTRLWAGKNPVRIMIDKELKLPTSFNLFNTEATTIVYNLIKNSNDKNLVYVKIKNENFIDQMLHSLFEMNIQSIIVEGGSKTLQSFIEKNLWDESRTITNEKLIIENGVSAPEMKNFILEKQERYLSDVISYYKNEAYKH
ncbi:MAG: bifunctional diaminohydroxyphosphoribosylaminopyrimidine deaminase/5-amino-6-(5-phosphoribosylamino)uracil reductase RibD [Ginsengibacter sp.]